VPCFPDRKYNQALLLAKYFYQFLKSATPLRFKQNIKFIPELFYRIKNTEKLHDKSASERKHELENAFKINENAENKNAEIGVCGQCSKILIIDDIVTTGTTINELGKILINKGVRAENIIGLTALGRNYH
jgi:predicted amidophosphoribosyltransferase